MASLAQTLANQQTVSMKKPMASAPPTKTKGKGKGSGSHTKPLTEGQKLDAADGKMDGRHFGRPIVGDNVLTVGEELDAADGKMDGKFYGHDILDAGFDGSTAIIEGEFNPWAVIPRHLPGDTDELVTCDLRDPSYPSAEEGRVCNHPCEGSYMLRRHRAYCPFNTWQCTNGPYGGECGERVPLGAREKHLEFCRYQKLRCAKCQEEYYRLDGDYHRSICQKMDIKCPLSCGMVLPRGELFKHIEQDFMKHSHEILECQEYLPENHPSLVYGILLRHLKDLRVQLELARQPGHFHAPTHKDHDLSPIYTPSKLNPYNEMIHHEQPSPVYHPPARRLAEPEPEIEMEEVEDW